MYGKIVSREKSSAITFSANDQSGSSFSTETLSIVFSTNYSALCFSTTPTSSQKLIPLTSSVFSNHGNPRSTTKNSSNILRSCFKFLATWNRRRRMRIDLGDRNSRHFEGGTQIVTERSRTAWLDYESKRKALARPTHNERRVTNNHTQYK